MRIRYTAHAEDRLSERRISKREVKEALLKGDKGDASDGLRKCVYVSSGRTLVIVYAAKGTADFEVVTAYFA